MMIFKKKLLFVLAAALFFISLSAMAVEDFEVKALQACETLARDIEKTLVPTSKITQIEYLVTWRAACAERPPTGPGNVKALCTGLILQTDGNSKGIFYWSKIYKGKINTGHFLCG